MAQIIGIIQLKGGTGRSTIATNLAGMMEKGKRVALIDCDMPQATSASWAAIRGGNLTLATASTHTELIQQIERLSKDHDFIVLDAPPRVAEITRAALVLSDLSLVPLGASAAEIWATDDLLATIEAAKAIKPDIDVRIVWNRFRAGTKSAKELSGAMGDFGLRELETKLGYRVAYSEALARGMTVTEWSDKVARDEMRELGRELESILKVKFMGGEK